MSIERWQRQAMRSSPDDDLQLRIEIEKLRSDVTRLAEARGEAEDKAESRERRVQQLIGEKAQLERQVERLEAALREANRELGAARGGSRPLPSTETRESWLDRLWSARDRLTARRARRDVAVVAPSPPLPAPSSEGRRLRAFAKAGEQRAVVAVLAVGLGPEQRQGVLDVAERYCGERGVLPLILTDDDDFEPLRRRRLLFEFLPPDGEAAKIGRAGGRLDWDLYRQRRLALIRRKWRPLRIIAFGAGAARFAKLWQTSPFEAPGIDDLFARRPDAGAAPLPATT